MTTLQHDFCCLTAADLTDSIYIVFRDLPWSLLRMVKSEENCFLAGNKPRQYVKKERHQFANKGPYSQPYGLSSSHIQLWELDHKEGREAKNWRFWTVVLRIPWIAERSNQSILKAINPEYSLEGLMLKLELQYFAHLKWTAESKEKTLVLGKIEGGRKRGWQDEMVGWHRRCNGHILGQTPGDGGGEGGLGCCSPWGHKESDTLAT